MKEKIEKEYEDISNEIKKIEKMREGIKKKPTVSNITKSIRDHWDYLSNDEKYQFLTEFVKKIVIVNKSKDKINGIPEIIDVEFYSEETF